MNIAVYFKLIRWKNLLLIIYVYLLIKFLFFLSFSFKTALSIFQFFSLLLSIILITAAGYIINDIKDVISDKINKPTKLIVSKVITREIALQWYKTTNTTGITLGVLFCLNIGKPSFSFIFIGASLLLYYYAKNLKSKPFIGNFIVAFLIGFSIFIIAILEFGFLIKNEQKLLAFNTIITLSIFAFFVNLTREIIKDIEDIDGDYAMKINTLPILLGTNRTKKIALITLLFPVFLLLNLIINYSEIYKFTMLYLIIAVFLPLLYVAIKLFSAKKKKQFKKISSLLKIIMFLGVSSLIIFSIFH
jgi:4-hydroxybenzoate polyprenyltransferase